MSAHFADFH